MSTSSTNPTPGHDNASAPLVWTTLPFWVLQQIVADSTPATLLEATAAAYNEIDRGKVCRMYQRRMEQRTAKGAILKGPSNG